MEFVPLLMLLGITIQSGAETGLPDYIIPCKASDEECLKKTIHALKPKLENGIPEFQLPSINSLYFPDLNVTKTLPPDLAYSATLTNIKFDAVDKYEVTKINVDLERLKFHLVINFPNLNLTMNEKSFGVVRGKDAKWEGTLRLKLKNAAIHFSLDGSYILKEGKQYVIWKEREINVTSGLIIYDLEDLFEDKEVLRVFLENIEGKREIIDGRTRLFVKDHLAKFILRAINTVHDSYPVNSLYDELLEVRNQSKSFTLKKDNLKEL